MRIRFLWLCRCLAAGSALLVGLCASLTPGGLSWSEEAAPEPVRRTRPAKFTDTRNLQRQKPITIQTSLKLARLSTAEFEEPPESGPKSFHELRLMTNTFESKNAGELGLPQTFELLCYNGHPVGPTIRVRRGTTFHIRVKNELQGTGGDKTVITDVNEQPHDFCSTNLHVHGLHVSPAGNADNIFQMIGPKNGAAKGQHDEFTFEYSVPADHPCGTFWYHPHLHGSVAYQLSNGVAGALIVEGGGAHSEPPKLEDVPEIAAARERILVFQLYNYRLDAGPKGDVARIDATTIYNVTPDASGCSAIPIPAQMPKAQSQATAINGVINPVLKLKSGEVQRWRLIHAAWDVNRHLSLVDNQDQPQPATDLKLFEIALDGLATGTIVEKGNDPTNPGLPPTVGIAPGQRSDVLIKAPLLKKSDPARVYHLRETKPDSTDPDLFLAKIVILPPSADEDDRPRKMKLPAHESLVKCQPFASIRDEELAKTPSFPGSPSLRFFASDDLKKYTINDKTFTHQATVQIRLDTAEEWSIKAEAASHPFHIHVNPFQVVMKTGSDGKCVPMNVWRDTLYIREGETYTIRSRFRDFLGKTVFHCHILDHEDQGMMSPIQFIPPYQTPLVPEKVGLQPTALPAPALKLARGKEATQTLGDLRPHPVILVFFEGAECAHCTTQLAELVRQARMNNSQDIEIVAVSSRDIADPAKSCERLGAKGWRHFHLLGDPERKSFRDFGCDDGGPVHGLFLIDDAGVIRAQYVGEAPYDNPKEAIRQARKWVRPR